LTTKGFRIEEIALRTGLTKRTLRYYEDLELIKPLRTESGYRLYSEEDIERVIRIKEIKDSLGFSLIDIKDILELERNLTDIFAGKISAPVLIEESLSKIKQQMELVEQKEQTLHRVKQKYQNTFQKLNTFYIELQERDKQ
jgi:DNA-binding transcriptional MerR regulator